MSETQVKTARVSVLSEGEYEVPVPSGRPMKLSALLDELGLANRGGQLYMDGAPVSGNATVKPGSETVVLPHIRGG
ncbi:MAG: hypothetical protein ACE5G2_03335 [Candidatus Krumholzibacteriia bacterium]